MNEYLQVVFQTQTNKQINNAKIYIWYHFSCFSYHACFHILFLVWVLKVFNPNNFFFLLMFTIYAYENIERNISSSRYNPPKIFVKIKVPFFLVLFFYFKIVLFCSYLNQLSTLWQLLFNQYVSCAKNIIKYLPTNIFNIE